MPESIERSPEAEIGPEGGSERGPWALVYHPIRRLWAFHRVKRRYGHPGAFLRYRQIMGLSGFRDANTFRANGSQGESAVMDAEKSGSVPSPEGQGTAAPGWGRSLGRGA